MKMCKTVEINGKTEILYAGMTESQYKSLSKYMDRYVATTVKTMVENQRREKPNTVVKKLKPNN
ncbi:MAG: hypothetical protein J6O62_02285 [Bacilli bacterium]|nr:hypothetical protein [Bacilli bacterium]MBO6194894.1 hypothetical protein [Bacilli bacterium]